MKETVKITGLGLLGLAITYLILKKFPKKEELLPEEKNYVYLQLAPIYVPTAIGEDLLAEVVDKLSNPKVKPTLNPTGWQLYWEAIPISTPVGTVNISLPARQLPLISNQKLNEVMLWFKPQVEKQDLLWKLSWPTIPIEV